MTLLHTYPCPSHPPPVPPFPNLDVYIITQVTFKDGVRVLELGCGAGLPGLYAWREGGLVDFADYNVEVLEHITIPNMLLNVSRVFVSELTA